MPRIIGRETVLGLAKETTRGVAAAPVFGIPVRDLDFDDKTELKDNESGYGNIAAIQDSQIIKNWGEGNYGGKIYDLSVGLELTALFGQSPTSVQRTTTGVYDHTYGMLNSNNHQSVTVALKEANYDGRWPNAMIDNWKLEAELDDFVRRTVSLVSKKSAAVSNSIPYTNENEFLAAHIAVKLAAVGTSSATMDGVAATKARSINLEINKNAEGVQVFGSKDLDDVHNKQLEVSGSFEMYYDARTYHALAAAGTHQAMRIDIINNEIIIGTSGAHNPALRFELSDIALSFPERGFDNNDIMTLSIPFRAMLNLTAGNMITARLTNASTGTNY